MHYRSGRVRGGGQQHVHESRPGNYLAAGNNWPDGRYSTVFTAAARTPKLGGVRADVDAVFADLKRPARHISYDDDFSVVVYLIRRLVAVCAASAAAGRGRGTTPRAA